MCIVIVVIVTVMVEGTISFNYRIIEFILSHCHNEHVLLFIPIVVLIHTDIGFDCVLIMSDWPIMESILIKSRLLLPDVAK